MPRVVSKTGAPVVELGVWVAAQGNAEFHRIMQEHEAQLRAGVPVRTAAFDAMFEQFLRATNQDLVD